MVHSNALTAQDTGDEWEAERGYHDSLLTPDRTGAHHAADASAEQYRTTPLFSVDVARKIPAMAAEDKFSQYGLFAKREEIYDPDTVPDHSNDNKKESGPTMTKDCRIFLNMNVGFSAFVCGSQGSGKSHTLSCMLESALIESRLGKLPQPLAGIVFHWDKHTGLSGNQPCEAAYLCSSHIPVTVLVSPSNYVAMKAAYGNFPTPKPIVRPLLLREKHLNASRMMKLMAVDTGNERSSLYMEVVCKVLREIALESHGAPDRIYSRFLEKLTVQKFQSNQSGPLNMRLQLLEAFLDGVLEEHGIRFYEDEMDISANKKRWENKQRQNRQAQPDIWASEPGSLTIVDLSDPFVDESAACALFDICLSLFLENQPSGRTIIALDEAHKYMSEGGSSVAFTESLLSAIRLFRHLGTRLVIATQEPTISPRLLDLCSMTIVHRFTSPQWLLALKAHLAGVSDLGDDDAQQNIKEIFRTIVNLETGQALLFSPTALLDVTDSGPKKLGTRHVKMRVRKRITADGGKSVSAT